MKNGSDEDIDGETMKNDGDNDRDDTTRKYIAVAH